MKWNWFLEKLRNTGFISYYKSLKHKKTVDTRTYVYQKISVRNLVSIWLADAEEGALM